MASFMHLSDFPISFNPWKHHLDWVRNKISLYLEYNNEDLIKEILENTNLINSNVIDLYSGNLSPLDVVLETDFIIKGKLIYNETDLLKWIGYQNYQLIQLSDNSSWVVRKGTKKELFIHLHPARYSLNTIRLQGNSWKTAIIILTMASGKKTITRSDTNNLREKYLSLSPVKDVVSIQKILKALKLLSDGIELFKD